MTLGELADKLRKLYNAELTYERAQDAAKEKYCSIDEQVRRDLYAAHALAQLQHLRNEEIKL